jgi:hypothetical protein
MLNFCSTNGNFKTFPFADYKNIVINNKKEMKISYRHHHGHHLNLQMR